MQALIALFILLAAVSCLGPTLLAGRLAARSGGWARRVYTVAALIVALPFSLVMVSAVTDTVRRYDGFCHHAPDIRYPCSLPRAVLEGVLPMSPFALFGYLLVGVVCWSWGCVVLAPTWWLIRRRQRR